MRQALEYTFFVLVSFTVLTIWMLPEVFFCTPEIPNPNCCIQDDDARRCGIWAWLHDWQEGWGAVLAGLLAIGAALITIRQMRMASDIQRQMDRYFNIASHAAAVHHFEKEMREWFPQGASAILAYTYTGGSPDVDLHTIIHSFPDFPEVINPSTGKMHFLGYTPDTADILNVLFTHHRKMKTRLSEPAITINAFEWFQGRREKYMERLVELKKKLIRLERFHKDKGHKIMASQSADYMSGEDIDQLTN